MSQEFDQQVIFTFNISKLIAWAYAQGYQLTFGEAWRTPQQAKWDATHGTGIVHSLHIERLAVDFDLFKDKEYLEESEDHRPLGEYWKTLDPLNRWGGDFHSKDGNHYSMEFQGRQ